MKNIIIVNILVAVGYCLAGYAGGAVAAITPVYMSPVWPAAGVALAALLLCGRRCLPGIIIGVFLTQSYFFLAKPDTGDMVASLVITSVISAGSVLQAVFGAWLVRKRAGQRGLPIEDDGMVRALLLAGPLSCITASSIGSATLYLANVIDARGIMLNWGSWWVGDTLGVLLVAPMLMLLFSGPRHLFLSRVRSVALPMLVLLVAVMAMFRYGYYEARSRMVTEFQRQTNILNAALTDQIEDNVDLATALKAFFDSSTEVTRQDFHVFADMLMKTSIGVQAMEWIPRVRENSPSIPTDKNWKGIVSIRKAGPNDQLIPPAAQDEYFPIRYLVPYQGNVKALGFNISSNPVALATVRYARDTGQTATTPPLALVQDPAGPPGTVLYAPVYSGKQDWRTIEQRREHLLGVVAVVFRVSDLVQRILNTYSGLLLNLVIQNEGEPLYSSMPADFHQTVSSLELTRVIHLNVADRGWDLTYLPTQGFFQHNLYWTLWWLLLSGFLLAAFLGGGLILLTGHTIKVEELVRRRTRELENETLERQRIIEMRDMQNMVLRAIAAPGSLEEILTFISELAVADDPDLSCSIQLLDEDGRHLRNIVSSRLPRSYLEAIDGLEIDKVTATFGTAAYMGKQIIVEDISGHPYWEKLHGPATKAGLRASWADPIILGDQILGTFTIYSCNPGAPDEYQLKLLQDLSRLAGIAIDQKQSESRIQKLAFYDALTDLPNRRLLLDRLDREIARARRHNTYGAVLFIDLDNFKTLNDSLGHQVGDLLLVQVAHRLKACIREEDTAARHGGDEFVTLLPADHEDLQKLTDRVMSLSKRILEDMNRPYSLDGYVHHISPSIGITFYSMDSENPDVVLKQADTAMYSAKARGRNTISFYHPDMQEHVDNRFRLERDMRTALQEGQFRLLFQPQYNKDEKIVGAEALIRWEHPERGLITPDQFIPLAEENKLIIPLGEWVIEQVCMRLREWTKLEYIAVNISPVQLHNEDFVERLRKILLPHEANIRRLMLEMTEGIMIENVEETTKTIRSLQKLGIGISIDDFGRGYSSLVYLKNLPLNQLKIDKGFVSDIEKDPNGKVIVGTIIAMATHLNLDVVAEGVETERQMEFLRDQGCNKYQGYYFSYPLTVKQFTKLHSENFSLHTGLTIQ